MASGSDISAVRRTTDEGGCGSLRRQSADRPALGDPGRGTAAGSCGLVGNTRRTSGDSMEFIIADVNRTLRGRLAYIQPGTSRGCAALDRFVSQRQGAIPRKRSQRRGCALGGLPPVMQRPFCRTGPRPSGKGLCSAPTSPFQGEAPSTGKPNARGAVDREDGRGAPCQRVLPTPLFRGVESTLRQPPAASPVPGSPARAGGGSVLDVPEPSRRPEAAAPGSAGGRRGSGRSRRGGR